MNLKYYLFLLSILFYSLTYLSNACDDLSIDVSNDIDLGCIIAGSYVEFNSSVHCTYFHIKGRRFSLISTEVITETEQSGVTLVLDWKIGNSPCFICKRYYDGSKWMPTGHKYIKMSVKSVNVESTATQGNYSFVQTVKVQYMGI